MKAPHLALRGPKPAGEASSPAPKTARDRLGNAGPSGFAETLSRELRKPGQSLRDGEAAKVVANPGTAVQEAPADRGRAAPRSPPLRTSQSKATRQQSGTGPGKDTGRPDRKATKPAPLATAGGEPTIPPVALAATRAATPLVKELRTPARGNRSSAEERTEARVAGACPESLPATPATIPVAPSLRPATSAAPSRTAPAPAAQGSPDLPAEGAVLRHAAHLRVESPGLGDVALHLRVRDGVAHVRFDGENAAGLREHAPELARALAREGLSLGRIDPPAPPSRAADAAAGGAGHPAGGWTGRDLGGQGSGHREQPREEADAPAPGPRRTERRAASKAPGRVHVQA